MHADGSSGVRWRLSPVAEAALIERFGDEIILFNPAAWTTHFLNAAAAIIFDELASGPRTAAELTAALREAFAEPADTSELVSQVEGTLRDLASIQLISPAETGT